jgi:hypothetical protein
VTGAPRRNGHGDHRLLPPLEWRVGLIAAAAIALLLVTTGAYGYHRDELYFIVAGQHPDWGYPDQPPFSPLLAAAIHGIAPGSLLALRLPSALAQGGVVLLGAVLAREMGGGRFAQSLSAAAVGVATFPLAVGHLLSTATFDLLAWVALTWLVARILRTGDDRLWLAAGALVGVALQNKHLIGFVVAALAVAILAAPEHRRHVRSRWVWAGAVLAAAISAPNLVWQAINGWPALAIAADIASEEASLSGRLEFVVLQLVIFGAGATVLIGIGLYRLVGTADGRRFRPLAWATGLLFVLFTLTGGKVYYLVGLYPALVAAGSVTVEGWPGRWRGALVTAVLLLGGLAAPISLPIMPAGAFARSFYAVPGEDQLNTIGWPELLDAVAAAHARIPTEDRTTAVVVTGNYGEAGAVTILGRSRGLPAAYSGHNAYGLWGPPPEGSGPVVVVGYGEQRMAAAFSGCRVVATVDNGIDAPTEEQGLPVWICDGPRGSWRDVWTDLVHLSG